MTGADSSLPDPDADAARSPAEALGPAWEMLDVLPRAETPPSMTASTIAMVAASAAGPLGSSDPRNRPARWQRISMIHWALPAAAVIGALVGGLILGRMTAPTPEPRVWTVPSDRADVRSEIMERIERLERLEERDKTQQRERIEQWRRREQQRRDQPREPVSPSQPENGRPSPAENRAATR